MTVSTPESWHFNFKIKVQNPLDIKGGLGDTIQERTLEMIKLLIEKPTTGLKHLCETCDHSTRTSGPGYDRYFCGSIGGQYGKAVELFHIVNDCSSYEAKNRFTSENFLPGQMKQAAYKVQQVNGRFEVLSPEEFALWDYATDNGKPYVVKRKR